MSVTPGGFYRWKNPPENALAKENEQLRTTLLEAHQASRGSYGRRRLTAAVSSDEELGFKPSIGRVDRQMKILGIAGYIKRRTKKTTIGDPLLEDSPNLIKDLQPHGIDNIWVSDITYIRTLEGWLFLCTIMDLFSRRIVGWAMDDNMKTGLLLKAFNMAHDQRNPTEKVIFHSDKGGQFKAKVFRRKLRDLKYEQSMTGKDHCFDNAHAESFFGTLKRELVRDTTFRTRDEAQSAIFEYIEVFYNRQRLHSSLGNVSPVSFERTA